MPALSPTWPGRTRRADGQGQTDGVLLVHHAILAWTSHGLFRIRGRLRGRCAWSVFVKQLRAYHHWPLFDFLPPTSGAGAGRRSLAVRGGGVPIRTTGALPTGLRLPGVHRIVELVDDRMIIVLEDVSCSENDWTSIGSPAPPPRAIRGPSDPPRQPSPQRFLRSRRGAGGITRQAAPAAPRTGGPTYLAAATAGERERAPARPGRSWPAGCRESLTPLTRCRNWSCTASRRTCSFRTTAAPSS